MSRTSINNIQKYQIVNINKIDLENIDKQFKLASTVDQDTFAVSDWLYKLGT